MVAQLDVEDTAFFPHRIRSISAEVRKDLAHLGRLCEDQARASDISLDANGRRDGRPQERRRLLDDAAQLEGFLLLLGLSAEGEHLSYRLPAPDTSLKDPRRAT